METPRISRVRPSRLSQRMSTVLGCAHLGGRVPDDVHLHAGCLRQGEGVGHARVVGRKPQDAGHQRLVGAVAGSGGGEGAVPG